MALVIEDGTGMADAESYATIAAINAYAVANGASFPITGADAPATTAAVAAAEAAARRGTRAIDGLYGRRFVGSRTNGRAQAQCWPRTGATDNDGEDIADDEIPSEIISAVCEAAIRELAEPGSLAPDLERGGAIKSLKAGSVAIEYKDGAPAETTFTTINNLLAGIVTRRSPVTFLERV